MSHIVFFWSAWHAAGFFPSEVSTFSFSELKSVSVTARHTSEILWHLAAPRPAVCYSLWFHAPHCCTGRSPSPSSSLSLCFSCLSFLNKSSVTFHCLTELKSPESYWPGNTQLTAADTLCQPLAKTGSLWIALRLYKPIKNVFVRAVSRSRVDLADGVCCAFVHLSFGWLHVTLCLHLDVLSAGRQYRTVLLYVCLTSSLTSWCCVCVCVCVCTLFPLCQPECRFCSIVVMVLECH